MATSKPHQRAAVLEGTTISGFGRRTRCRRWTRRRRSHMVGRTVVDMQGLCKKCVTTTFEEVPKKTIKTKKKSPKTTTKTKKILSPHLQDLTNTYDSSLCSCSPHLQDLTNTKSSDIFLRAFFGRAISGEALLVYNFVPINWLWSGFISPARV